MRDKTDVSSISRSDRIRPGFCRAGERRAVAVRYCGMPDADATGPDRGRSGKRPDPHHLPLLRRRLRVACRGGRHGLRRPGPSRQHGRLCSKGAALGDTLATDGRLLYPQIGGRNASWDEALDRVAAHFTQTIAEHGPDAVALYVSGQFLTEDYYVANKLMKGFIGSANIDTNSRLCMASSVAGHVRAFGEDIVPGCYEDIEAADLVVLVGSNTAWCHPVLYQRLAAAKEKRGTKIVAIDPRRTATCDIADLHLAIRPGSDVAVFAGLLVHLAASGPATRRGREDSQPVSPPRSWLRGSRRLRSPTLRRLRTFRSPILRRSTTGLPPPSAP